jgi:DNA polymerase-3 subunit beta
MKLTIERAALLKALAHVQSVVERRNTIPILSNVLITAQKGRLSLAATDMDLAITEQVEASAAKAGSTTAPAHTLYEIVRKLPDGAQVELETASDDNSLVVRAGRSRFTLQCLPPADFPAMAEGDLPHRFQLPATDLKGIIDRTRFAISNEETRYYLNGIYFHAASAGGTAVLRGVATDGHRLARVEVPLPKGASEIPGVIVPRKTVGEVRKLLDESDGSVEVELSDTRIRFASGGVTLVSKLIDGTFPDYERVIPTGNDKVLNVP